MEPINSRFSVSLDADAGGRIASLLLDGVELLVAEGDKPIAWGAYPMVPWAGRMDRGTLHFDGQSHQFPINIETHAIHGTALTSKWVQRSPTVATCELVAPWPLGGNVTHSVDLREDRVRFKLSVEATQPMPAQVGWHPWFRRDVGQGEQLEVRVSPRKMYEISNAAIPTGKLVAPPPPPWDNCFIDLAMPPRLAWPGFAELELRSSCDHWVIFDHPQHAICVEPQSGPPNALNTKPVIVTPDEPLVAWFEIVVV